MPKYALRPKLRYRPRVDGLDVYVPGPLTHTAQLLSGAAPVPRLAIASKILELATPFEQEFPDPEIHLQDAQSRIKS